MVCNYKQNTSNKDKLWFAAKTIANIELKMRNYLNQIEVENYIPSNIELLKKKNEIIEIERPIIKNLLFFKTDFATAHAIFNANPNKLFRVRNSKGLIIIPEREMNEFMSFTNHHAKKIITPADDYLIGDVMIIKSGPFAGMKGVVAEIAKKTYFTLQLYGILSVTVQFPKSNLIKLCSDRSQQ